MLIFITPIWGQSQMLSPLVEPFTVMVEKEEKIFLGTCLHIQRLHKKILQKSHNIKTLSCHKSYGMVLTYIQRKNEAEYRARVKAKCP